MRLFKNLARRHRASRLAALGLALAMGAGLLGGCKAKGVTDKQERPAVAETKKEEEPEAMGRYIETAVDIPGIRENDRFVSFFRGREKKLELYTAAQDEEGYLVDVRRFLQEGDTWRQDEGWWDRVKPRDISPGIRRVFYGLDGKYYFSVMSREDYVYHLYQIQEEGESVELLADLFVPPEGREFGMIPPKAEVGKDGGILIYGIDDAAYYGPDGTKRFSMEKSWGGTSENSEGYLTEEEFVTKTDEGVARYRLSDGQKKEVIPFDWGDNPESLVMFDDGEGGIYVAAERGLAHVGAGGSLWELLIDGSLNTMGMRSVYLQQFLQGDEKDYYGLYVSDGSSDIKLYHYTYDANAAAVPPMSLTVYSLKDNSTIRQAAALFQKDHPDVRVEVLSSVEERGTISEEMIRVLNTELLSGKGADVLVLDGLPWKSYEEKGILADMRETFEKIEKEDPLMDPIIGDFTREDGAIYQMPARIGVPVVIGTEAEHRAFDSLEAMVGYKGEKPLTAPETYENIMCFLANLQYRQLFGSGEKGISQEVLVRYLESAKAIGEENGSRTMFTEEEMERLWVSNRRIPYGIRGTDTHFDYGMCACGVENMNGLSDFVIPEAILKKHGEASMETIHGSYFPRTLIGINQASDRQELAAEFVRYLFSQEAQKEEFVDGFPVNLAAQEENCTSTARDDISIGSGIGDYHISGNWPTQEERRELYKIIRSVSVPVMVDETIMNMITDGSRDYFDGKIDAGQAAASICRQIALYEAEQE